MTINQFRATVVNDPHLADVPPRWRRPSYTQEVLDKLAWVVAETNRSGNDVLCLTGDIFHNPVPHRVSHYLVHQLTEVLKQLQVPLLVVPGNHDLGSGGLATLNRQPLGMLLAALPGAVLLSSDSPLWVDPRTGTVVAGYEWQNDMECYFDGTHLGSARQTRYDLLLLHAPVALRENPHYETVSAARLAVHARCVVYGHLHPPEKPYRSGACMFANPGALARGSLTPSDLERTPQLAWVTLYEGDVREVKVSYHDIGCALPAEQVFLVEQALFEREYDAATSRFVESLGQASLDRVTLDGLKQLVAGMTEDRAVRLRCRQILEGVA